MAGATKTTPCPCSIDPDLASSNQKLLCRSGGGVDQELRYDMAGQGLQLPVSIMWKRSRYPQQLRVDFVPPQLFMKTTGLTSA